MQNKDEDDSLKKREFVAQSNLLAALDMEEYFWREKSRVNWQLEGDRNTTYGSALHKL